MNSAYSEQYIITKETNIELMDIIQKFVNDMEEHIEKFPDYSYNVEMLGGKKGMYNARLIVTKHGGKKENKTT